MLKLRVSSWLAAALLLSASAVSATTLTVQIAGNRITVNGVTPHGEVIFFGRSVVYQSGMPRLERHATVLTDADRDGIVTWTLDAGVPPYSTWAIVDYESGASVIASPAGFTPPRFDLPAVVWRGGESHIDLDRDYVDVLFVRPRHGAWMLGMWQGGRFDADARNDAKLRAGLAAMKPLHGTKAAPPTAIARDVIVIIDPRQLDVFMRQAD